MYSRLQEMGKQTKDVKFAESADVLKAHAADAYGLKIKRN
jgi:hypothetical protein